MFEKVVQDLGITEGSVKRAIRSLLNDSPELKVAVGEILGDIGTFKFVGEIDGVALYRRK